MAGDPNFENWIVFRLQQPYNVILDGNFIHQALKYKLDIHERLTKLFQDAVVKLFIQQSVLNELQNIGSVVRDSIVWSNKFCQLIDDTKYDGDTPAKKLVGYIDGIHQERKQQTSNLSRQYVVATQDKHLRHELSKIPGVPAIYFNKVSLVLEPPSKSSRSFGQDVEKSKISAQIEETDILATVKTPKDMKIIGVSDGESNVTGDRAKVRVKRKAKAPNSLSSLPANQTSSSFKKNRKNKYKRSS